MTCYLYTKGFHVPKAGWKIRRIKQLADGMFEVELEPP